MSSGTSYSPSRLTGFFSPDECRALIAEIDAAYHAQAKIWLGDGFGVHADSRSGTIANLELDTEARVHTRLWDAVPKLQERFGCDIGELTGITALLYGRGDHFAAHSDGGIDDGAPPEVSRRRLSLVVSLNDGARDFQGGELRFYPDASPPDAAQAEHVISVRSEPGLLIAFPSPMTHRVMPVLEGCRYALALWALAPE